MIKVGTDFSGIGAPEQALKNLGYDFENVFFCEIDKHAARSYQAIHASKKYYEDITKRDHAEVEPLDLYVAGFPCQSFSMAGNRKGWATDENGQPVDKRGTLFFDVAKFIQINQPKVFILENVKGLISHEGGKTYQTITDILTNGGGTLNGQMSLDVFDDGLGYHVYAQVLNSKHHGVPQNRERIFIVGFKDFRPFSFPKTEPLKLRLKDVLQDNADSKYILSDKMISYFETRKDNFNNGKINYKGENDIASAITRNSSSIDISDNIVKIEVGTYRTHKDGRGFRKIQDGTCPTIQARAREDGSGQPCIKIKSATKDGYEIARQGDSINFKNPNSETRRGRVGKQISQTIEANNEVGVFSDNIRRLTPLECWRLQDFPDEAFYKAQAVTSDAQLYRQAGNSITVRVIQKLIKKIYET